MKKPIIITMLFSGLLANAQVFYKKREDYTIPIQIMVYKDKILIWYDGLLSEKKQKKISPTRETH